jgi:hypothetical protein
MDAGLGSQRRRSARILRNLPIRVSGIDARGRDFRVLARTLLLSRFGAEILLNRELKPEQQIRIGRSARSGEQTARVVGLYSKREAGNAYGIEFLSQKGNFWEMNFSSPPSSTTEPGKADAASPGPSFNRNFLPTHNQAATPQSSKTYLIRLRCLQGHFRFRDEPGSDEDNWLIVRDRPESLQQVLSKTWEFTCPIHGLQRERPLEAKESDAGFQPHFPNSSSKTVTNREIENAGSKPLLKARREHRTRQGIRVWVYGIDRNGNSFRQSALSLDVSRNGARLEGLGLVTLAATTVEVRRNWRKGLFRVVWTGQRGTPAASQIGIVRLQPGKELWDVPESG